MTRNLTLDEELIETAQRLGGHKSKREAVTAALEDYVRRHQPAEMIDLPGRFEWHDDRDLRVIRRRKRQLEPK